MDRVRELGDASVPFRFDVHALVFSDDAVGLENRLHADLTERRVNRVNLHREFFRARPAEVLDLLTTVAGSRLLEFTETPEALEWRASGTTTAVAPLPPEHADVPATPSANANDSEPLSPPAVEAPEMRQLSPGQVVPLRSSSRLRLLVSAAGADVEIDPVALLLTSGGTVSADADLVFFGQPDHPTGAAAIAADEEGAAHALHLDTGLLRPDIAEVLLTVAVADAGSCGDLVVDLVDLSTGRPVGRTHLPQPSHTGLLQVGALQRGTIGWNFLVQPAAMDMDLATLVTAAGVIVDE